MSESTEELTKACPVLGCKERIDYDHLACHRHWYDLPANLRSASYHAWHTGVKKNHDLARWHFVWRKCEDYYRQELGYGIKA